MTGYHKFQLLILAVAAAGWIALGGDVLPINEAGRVASTAGQVPAGKTDRHTSDNRGLAYASPYTPCPKQNAAHKWLEIEIAQGCPGKHCTIYCQYEGARFMTRDEARL